MIAGFILFPGGEKRGTLPFMVHLGCAGLPQTTHVTSISAAGSSWWFMLVRFEDASMTATVIQQTEARAALYFPNEQLFLKNFSKLALRFLRKRAPAEVQAFRTSFNNQFGRTV